MKHRDVKLKEYPIKSFPIPETLEEVNIQSMCLDEIFTPTSMKLTPSFTALFDGVLDTNQGLLS